MDFNNIPDEIKIINNWSLWKLEKRNDKTTKHPYQIDGVMAKVNTPSTWTTFNNVIETYNHREGAYSGIGFNLLGSGLTIIDIDHCIEDGIMSEKAQTIIDYMGSYTEKSQSGTGVHILAKGSIPKGLHQEIEMYCTGRYFALTGDVICGDVIESRQEQLDVLYKSHQKKEIETKQEVKVIAPKGIDGGSADGLLEKAFNSKNGAKIRALYYGDTSDYDKDDSKADQALCNYLAFWFDKDWNSIDSNFKSSGLYRNKWNRPDYKASTIDRAINGCNKSYQELMQEKQKNKPSKKENNKGEELDFPFKNYKNQPLKVWENLDFLLKFKNIEVKHNLLSREIEVIGYKKSLDELMVEFNTLALTNGFNLGIDEMARFVAKIAKENSYNPVIDYLKKCKSGWDGVSRIKDLCNTIQCYGDNNFKELLITKWLINTVHIISNKGKNNCEGVLVIQGKQGIGKTRWIRSIMPNLDWLKTGVAVDPGDKDSVSKATKYWVVELGEMEATLKKDQAELKQFFTENSDEYREPYGRFSNKFPRLTCFYATVNDLEFLKDVTGNRRYWAIEALSVNVDHNIDLEQLWGEIVTLYTTKKITNWLTIEENAILQENNIKFEVKTGTEIKILDNFDWSSTNVTKWKYYTASEIADFLEERNPVLIGKAIKKMMLNNELIKFNTNGRKYLLPPKIIKRSLYEQYDSKYNM